MEIDITKSVKLVRSLLVLRDIQPEQIAFQSGISLENLRAWLRGESNTLGAHSYVELFKFLGVSKTGLLADRVHLWKIDTGWSGKFDQKQLSVLEWAGNLLSGCKMLEVTPKIKEKTFLKNLRVFMILGNNVRVMVHISGKWSTPPSLDTVILPGVTWESEEGNAFIMQSDQQYWKIIEEGSLTISEFDDVFTGDFMKCSWNNLRLVAREYGVTPAMISNWIVTRGRPMLAAPKSEPKKDKLPEARRTEKEIMERDIIDIEQIPDMIVNPKRVRPEVKKTPRKKPAARGKKKQDEIIIEPQIHPAEQMGSTDTH